MSGFDCLFLSDLCNFRVGNGGGGLKQDYTLPNDIAYDNTDTMMP